MATAKKTGDKAAEKPVTPKAPASPLVTSSINPAAGKTIDERMADLLAEHQAMGARPKDEPAK
jgi:hypothetical protein